MATPSQLCQLAGTWNRGLPAWCVAECKFDGFRCLWLRDWEGRPGLYSRNGMPLPGLEHIAHELAAWERHAGERLFLDGELIVGDGPDTLATTKRWVESGHKLGGTAGVFHCFDGFAYDDWLKGGTANPLYQRKRAIEAIAAAVDADEDHRWQWRPGARGDEPCPVRVVPHVDLWSVDDALVMAAEMWKANLEGIVIKDATAPYVRQRSNAWAKVGRPWQSKIHWKVAA